MKLLLTMVSACVNAVGRFWGLVSTKEQSGESTAILKTTLPEQGRSRANSFLIPPTVR